MSLVEWEHNDCNEHKRWEVSVVHVDSSRIIDRFIARNSGCRRTWRLANYQLQPAYLVHSLAFVGNGADDLGKMEAEENSEEVKSRRTNREVKHISAVTPCRSFHIVPLLSLHNLEQGRCVS